MIPSAALAAIPGCGPGEPAPRVTALAGGVVNRAFRVDTRAGAFVLRLHAHGRRAVDLGVDRDAEIAAQRLAAAAGLAPAIVAAAADQSFLVTAFVHGDTATAAQLATPDGMARLGGTLQRLRAIAPPPALRGLSLIERARRLAARARAAAPAAAAPIAAALLEAERGWQRAGPGREPCLVHSDPNPGNVVLARDAATATLLDWEYAHVGDPLQDPAAWLQACPVLRGREVELLRACGLETRADVSMLAGMAAVYAALECAWLRLAETAAGIPSGRRAN